MSPPPGLPAPTPLPDPLVARLRSAEQVLITSHESPDGDAIGSQLGLARILEAMGKRVTIWDRDPAPTVFRTLEDLSRIHVGEHPPDGYPERFDLLVTLECPTLERSGLEPQLEGHLPILNVDHHLGNGFYGTVDWVDPHAPAVAEMVNTLASALAVELDAGTADRLLLALFSDTGGFRFSNATPRAFDCASELVRRGASPERASFVLWEQRPVANLRLAALMLGSLRVDEPGVASAVLRREMYCEADARREDAEGLIEHLRAIAGVEAVALLREDGENQFKASLRSRGAIDVEAVARRHDGGGHRNAAGCVLTGPEEEVRSTLVAELSRAVALGRAAGSDGDRADRPQPAHGSA